MRTLLVSLAVLAAAGVATAAAPPRIANLGPWTASGARLTFVASVGGRSGLWTERLGSTAAPKRLGPAACGKEEQVDVVAPGPSGSLGCLERTHGNTSSFYSVDVISADGHAHHVATAGDSTADSIPFLFGDGAFLGYLRVTGTAAELVQVGATGHATTRGTLPGVTNPLAVAVAGGHVAVQQAADVLVFTTAGKRVADVPIRAASVALTSTRLVVRTHDRRLAVFALQGALLHFWPLGAATWSAGLAAYANHAVYLGANKAVRSVNLTTGTDKIVLRAGSGFFFGGVAATASGAVAPLTTQSGRNFFVSWKLAPLG